jgi:hypothetical protein
MSVITSDYKKLFDIETFVSLCGVTTLLRSGIASMDFLLSIDEFENRNLRYIYRKNIYHMLRMI